MTKKERNLVIKWYEVFTQQEMNEVQANEFLADCKGDADLAERVMKYIAIRYRYLDL